MTLSDPDPSVRIAFVRKLASQPDTAVVPHLLRALRDDDPYVRKEAADALGQWDRPDVVDALVDVVLNESSQSALPSDMTLSAALALAPMDTYATWLEKALGGEDLVVRQRAEALSPVVEAAKAGAERRRRYSGEMSTFEDVKVLAKSGTGFIPELLSVLAQHFEYVGPSEGRDDVAYLRWMGSDDFLNEAVTLLHANPDLALEELTVALSEHPNHFYRAIAAHLLGDFADERAVGALVGTAGSYLSGNEASTALGKIARARIERLRSAGDVQQLVDELRDKWGRVPATLALSEFLIDSAIRDTTVQALHKLFDPHVIGFLIHQIKGIDHYVEEALAAATVLAELPEVRPTIPTLVDVMRALGVEAPKELEACIERIGGAEAERALAGHRARRPEPLSYAERIRVFYSGRPGGEDDEIEAETDRYLKSVAETQAKKQEEVEAGHLAELERSDDYEVLSHALRSGDEKMRNMALSVVRQRRDPRFATDLVELLQRSIAADDRRLMDKVAKALGGMDPAAVAALLPAAKDDNPAVRWVTAGLFGDIGGAEALTALESLQGDSDEFVREAAQAAVERIESR